MFKTIWLFAACFVFGLIHVIALGIFLLTNKNKSFEDWTRDEEKFALSPIGIDGFQLVVWRISLISRRACLVLGCGFLLIEVLLLIFRCL